MTPLSFVTPGDTPATLNTLLYGPPGTGKSVAACSAPGPILYVNSEGPTALLKARQLNPKTEIREVAFENAATLDQTYLYLKDHGGKERTVVLDTIGEAHRALLDSYGGERPTLQQYGDVNLKIERFVRALRDLPINVVLVAHEQIDDQDGALTRRPLTGGKKLPEVVMAMVDIVAYTGVVTGKDDAAPTYWGQVIEAEGRRCKDRSGALGEARQLDLTDWISTATAALAPPPNGDVEPINKSKRSAA